MELKLGSSIIYSYKRLSYTAWYALAEFVDNSTQAFLDNRPELVKALKRDKRQLEVSISYEPDADRIVIEDNSMGMSKKDLERALTIGLKPENDDGRSKYGLGMKTAACWLGDYWVVETTKLGDTTSHRIEVDVKRIGQNTKTATNTLKYTEKTAAASEHGTRITITRLNRKFPSRTIGKIKDYLRSMYRFDFAEYGLQLKWQGDLLLWEGLSQKLYITESGTALRYDIDFTVTGDKRVRGWVGVLAPGHGSRKNAGFSVIKANRVIEGWPRGFKPASVFGDQEDGTNDLINQRVVGELFLDDFEVSHTKDQIVWLGNEYEEVEEKLGIACEAAMSMARTLRFKDLVDKKLDVVNEAAAEFKRELQSNEIRNFMNTVSPPPEAVLMKVVHKHIVQSAEKVDADIDENIEVELGKLRIRVYFIRVSEFDPYVAIEINTKADVLDVVVNAIHPHVQEMTTSETLTNYVRHCVYDGVAEWQALKMLGDIQPYTVKTLKDGLLRLPFQMKQNSFVKPKKNQRRNEDKL